jgi:hypothetical protein
MLSPLLFFQAIEQSTSNFVNPLKSIISFCYFVILFIDFISLFLEKEGSFYMLNLRYKVLCVICDLIFKVTE